MSEVIVHTDVTAALKDLNKGHSIRLAHSKRIHHPTRRMRRQLAERKTLRYRLAQIKDEWAKRDEYACLTFLELEESILSLMKEYE